MNDVAVRAGMARTEMIAAWADLATLALQSGADPERVTELQGRFFDGNVALKAALREAGVVTR